MAFSVKKSRWIHKVRVESECKKGLIKAEKLFVNENKNQYCYLLTQAVFEMMKEVCNG